MNRIVNHLVTARHSIEIPAAAIAAGAAIWELAGWVASLPFLPPFSRVVAAAIHMAVSGQILEPVLASIASLIVGYGAAAILGMTVGVLMGQFPILEYVLAPYVNAALAAPKIVLVPVLFAFFGLSHLIQMVVIFLSAFFVIVLNTMRGVQVANPECMEMARAFGASEGQCFRKVLLPSALPLATAGLRLAVGHAIRSMIAAEMLIAVFGLGALLRSYGSAFEAERVFAILLVVLCVAFACTSFVRLVERRLTRWVDTQA